MSPIAGGTRFRFNQLGFQSVIGTAVPATRRVPWRGAVTYQPNRTDIDADFGSLDPIASPYPTAVDVGWNPTGPATYDDLPIRLAAGLKGGVTPSSSGTARIWDYQVASLTADDFDYATDEYGDDTGATDTIVGFGGVADVLEETMPEDGGPVTINDTWIFAGGNLGQDGTDSLSIDDTPVMVFATDTAYFMNTTPGSIGVTRLEDVVHTAQIRISNNLDKKRYQNGSNSRFQLSGYGRGPRVIELILTLGKTAAAIAEANTLDDDPVPNRFFKVQTNSLELAGVGNPFTYERFGAFRLFERSEGESNNNATIVLTYRAYYDATLGYAYRARVVNQLTALP